MATCPNCGASTREVTEPNVKHPTEREKRALFRCDTCQYQYRDGDSLEPARKP
jgi:uncharacterized protein with PIN domain